MRALLSILFFLSSGAFAADTPTLVVGSKNFVESYVLAEILAQAVEQQKLAKIERRLGLGGTGITYQALLNGEIDVYPDYSGTVSLAILNSKKHLTLDEMRNALAKKGIAISAPLGFDNSYALAVPQALSQRLSLTKISQLKDHPTLRMAFSYEFMERKDGFPALVRRYRLAPAQTFRMDHSLVYSAVREGKADVIEVYTTDANIEKNELVILEDDLDFFPKYKGLFLVRKAALEKVPGLASVLEGLGGTLSNDEMQQLNSLVEIGQQSFADAAGQFFDRENVVRKHSSLFKKLARPTRRHLLLVFLPLALAIAIGVPLGVAAAKLPRLGQVVLLLTGLIQTLPALALLCFLIPFLGIGLVPAVVALVLYGLLPIVRGTHSGLVSIDHRHYEVCRVLGLSFREQLFHIELPLASIHVLSGIKTAAVMTVGMATLAAFIGAGGYGSLIVTGLALNDNTIILQGALPAALMAIATHYAFEFADRFLVPRGIRLK